MPKTIIEKAIFAKPEKIKKYLDGKVIFETYLQEAETTNQNKRIYPKAVIDDGLNRILKKIDRRGFLGELDHPISSDQVRQTTVLYKEVSHIIREYSWENNLLRAVVETTPYTPNGKILGGLITDHVPVGFSLRGLADVQDSGSAQHVMSPLIMIAYDSVSEPSNSRATIQEVRNESLKMIMENNDYTETASGLICTKEGICYMPEYFEEIVEKNLFNLREKYLKK